MQTLTWTHLLILSPSCAMKGDEDWGAFCCCLCLTEELSQYEPLLLSNITSDQTIHLFTSLLTVPTLEITNRIVNKILIISLPAEKISLST